MDELAIRFAGKEPADVVFVSWVKDLGAMCELDFVATRTHRGDGIDYMQNSSAALGATSTRSTPPFERLVKRVVKKVATKSRLDRTSLFQKVKAINHNQEIKNYKTYTPQKGDKFFISWGEWWDQGWLNNIKSYQKAGTQIYPICHDILPMLVPQFSGNSASLSDFVTQIFPISTTVLTPSESTKRDLIVWMKDRSLHVPNVKSFRLGEDFSVPKVVVSDEDMTRRYAVEKDQYLIAVGTIEPRKNHTLLYYTYKLAAARNIMLPKLLIVGRIGHDTSEIIKFIHEDPDTIDRIKIRTDVGDEDLDWLYQNCMFTVQPSFYEGWGMPVIESIARGKSAICSNTSSLTEMPDECVLRFHPASTDECLRAIQEMMKPDTLKRYRNAVSKYKPHSWDDSFKQVITILGDD